jgi:hypothetical protein
MEVLAPEANEQCRGITTRYVELAAIYGGTVLRAITIWLQHLSETRPTRTSTDR